MYADWAATTTKSSRITTRASRGAATSLTFRLHGGRRMVHRRCGRSCRGSGGGGGGGGGGARNLAGRPQVVQVVGVVLRRLHRRLRNRVRDRYLCGWLQMLHQINRR